MKVRFAVAPHAGSLSGPGVGAFADALEASGFDGIWLSDLPVAPVLDPLLGLALIAGRTTRLRLGANLVPLGRNPFLLAKQLAQLDQISAGRLLLSFVTGLGQPGEREALGLGAPAEAQWSRKWSDCCARGGRANRSNTTLTGGRSPASQPPPARFRTHWRFGSAAVAPRRLTEWEGSPTAGWARNSPSAEAKLARERHSGFR